MSKLTLFIAVQCHQCSTMQVKQQKKSSNKWNCAVCNEKQSVRKVYAQGYQAKDIRQVVQSFNMSRKFADDQKCQESSSLGHFIEHLEGDDLTEKAVKKRSDWSEYVDVDEDCLEPAYLKSTLQEKQMFEHKVVTELPEEMMFKKPKLKGGYDSSSLKSSENRTYKPQFTRKSAVNKELTKNQPVSSNLSAARNEVKFNIDNGNQSQDIISRLQDRLKKSEGVATMKTGASKWADYLEEDNDCHFEGKQMRFTDNSRVTDGRDGYKVQTDEADLLVEEDIHPDFM